MADRRLRTAGHFSQVACTDLSIGRRDLGEHRSRTGSASAAKARESGDRVSVRSAGTAPVDTIDPAVIAALAELGVDLHATGARPKKLTDQAVQASDVVITMGCDDECPFYAGKRYLDWKLDDPAGLGVDAVRPIRDEIDRRVQQLAHELVIEPER